jgi:hypothetical protein
MSNAKKTAIKDSIIEEEFSIPLNVSEILDICQKFSSLGYSIQNQIIAVTELGVEEAVETGLVKKESLPFIEEFLTSLTKNAYFGDAATEAQEYLFMLKAAMPISVNKSVLELN